MVLFIMLYNITLHTLFYLVSYTLYIDIVPNKFTSLQFSNQEKVIRTLTKSVDETLVCDGHSNESY